MAVQHEARCPEIGPKSGQRQLRIVLEPLHGSLLKNIVNILGPAGAGTWRFVAITEAGDRLEGPTFVSPRNIGGDQTPDPKWAPDMHAALVDLQRQVERAGWRKVGEGTKFWNCTYSR